jgi:hypothetical protein
VVVDDRQVNRALQPRELLIGAAGFGHDTHIRLIADQPARTYSDRGVIVDQQDAD